MSPDQILEAFFWGFQLCFTSFILGYGIRVALDIIRSI